MSKERGEQLAIEYQIKFVETSAKDSLNVEYAFYTLARDIKAKMEKKQVCNSFFQYILWFFNVNVGFYFEYHNFEALLKFKVLL